MRARSASATVAMILALLLAAPVRADPTSSDLGAELHALVGAASAPFGAVAFPEVLGQALLLRPLAAVRLASPLWARVEMPVVLTSVRQPAGTYVDEAAWGNPAVSVEYGWNVPLGSTYELFQAARARLGLPLGEHGPRASQMANRALAVADAIEALREPSLYLPGVASTTFEYRADLAWQMWQFGAGIALPLLVRVDEAELPSESTRSFGTRPRLDLRALYQPKPWFGVGGEGSLVLDVARVTEPIRHADREKRVQPSLSPHVIFDTGRLRFVISCRVAIGGPAHGSAGCGGEAGVRF